MSRPEIGQVIEPRLTLAERTLLAELEGRVERGLASFIDVGNALLKIRELGLYRETHPTFKAYCTERLGHSDSRARQLIAAAKTVTDVTAAGLPAPRTEGEARRLARSLRGAWTLEQHPLVKGRLPDIEGAEFVAFAKSIERHGLVRPIVLHEGMILDGWQRYRACRQVGRGPTFTECTSADPFAFWFSCNLMRKSLTRAERSRVEHDLEQLTRKED